MAHLKHGAVVRGLNAIRPPAVRLREPSPGLRTAASMAIKARAVFQLENFAGTGRHGLSEAAEALSVDAATLLSVAIGEPVEPASLAELEASLLPGGPR